MDSKNTKLPAYSETLPIEGMTCASCVGRVEKALKKIENVEIANVNLATEKAVVYSNQPIQRKALVKAVERAGYDVPKAAPVELSIEGMTCASCVARVEKALKKVDGVQEATVNLATEQAWVQADASVNVEDLIRAVKKAGYDAKASEKIKMSSSIKKLQS